MVGADRGVHSLPTPTGNDSAPQTTSHSPEAAPQVSCTAAAADGASSTAKPAEAAIVQRRKRSESPTPPNETSDTSPPGRKKPRTDKEEGEKTSEPAAVKNDDKDNDKAARTHKSDKVDFATRLTVAAPRCPQKAYKNRLRCCERLYDALASESEASKGRTWTENSSHTEKANNCWASRSFRQARTSSPTAHSPSRIRRGTRPRRTRAERARWWHTRRTCVRCTSTSGRPRRRRYART